MRTILLLVLSLLSGGALQASEREVYIAKYRGDRACAVSYTFDDGLVEQYTLAAPEFEKRGFRATFAINGAKINQDARHLTDSTRMTWAQVKDLFERGHEISNHGWRHRNFARFPIEEIKEDIFKNDSAILAVTGVRPRTFVYPNNNKKDEGRRIAEQGRVGTRTRQRSLGSKTTPESLEKWVTTLIQTGDWGVGMTHGLTYGYDAFRNPQRFWEHLDRVKACEDSVWVGTFCEVAAYVEESRNTRLQVEEQGDRLAVTPEMALDKELFDEPLTLVVGDVGDGHVTAWQDGKNLSVVVRDGKALIDFNPSGGTVRIHLR